MTKFHLGLLVLRIYLLVCTHASSKLRNFLKKFGQLKMDTNITEQSKFSKSEHTFANNILSKTNF